MAIMKILNEKGARMIVYEPYCKEETFLGAEVTKDIDFFKKVSNVILANRYDVALENVRDKVITRDIFYRD